MEMYIFLWNVYIIWLRFLIIVRIDFHALTGLSMLSYFELLSNVVYLWPICICAL